MEHTHALIVQAEFFLIPSGSFENIRENIENAVRENVATKVCVRFFDTRGLVSKAVLQAHIAEARGKAILDVLSLSSTPEHTTEFGSPYQSAREEFSVRQQDLRRCVIREVRFVMNNNLGLALEQNDHSYRPLLQDEHEKLIKQIAGSSGLWVFLFPPNNLLADSHVASLSVM